MPSTPNQQAQRWYNLDFIIQNDKQPVALGTLYSSIHFFRAGRIPTSGLLRRLPSVKVSSIHCVVLSIHLHLTAKVSDKRDDIPMSREV